ncbi:hypothetical protein J6590_028500 [Homalodisca vitripennis]|nr:hypothetical protein J6590_028500 [Homalodisca vitripennis]
MAVAMGTDVSVCECCENTIISSESVLLCEAFCNKRYHAACLNIDDDKYGLILSLKDSVKWVCERCETRLESMKSQVINADEYLNLHELVGKLMVLVKNIITDNVEINKKLDSLSCDKFNNFQSDCKTNPAKYHKQDDVFKIKDVSRSVNVKKTFPPSRPLTRSQSKNVSLKQRGANNQIDHVEGYTAEEISDPDLVTGENENNSPEVLSTKNITSANDDTRPGQSDVCSGENDSNSIEEQTYAKVVNSRTWKKKSLMYPESSNSMGSELKNCDESDVILSKKNQRTLRRQQILPETSKHQSRSKPIFGTKIGGEVRLKTAATRLWIFVSKLDIGVTKSEIESYLSSYNITNVVCEEVKPKYDTYKSFKIGVCEEVFETVLDPEFWDEEERIVNFSTTTLTDECTVSFGFECLFLNIQGLRNKTLVFEDFLKDLSGKSSFVLICISEHWLNLDELALHVPSGYQMASAFCRKNHIRGGSAIFIRVNIEFRIIDVSDLCRELIFEVAVIALDVCKLIVVSLYHPPGTDPGEF